ncbi:MAG TPA: c-type cytochrome [Acidimicrobiales bacterium]|nr:c-type cytochrome [Acidimicrobiales bacterium]
MTFAATTQQTIAIVVFLVVIAGSIAFFFANNRKAKPEVGSEIELAPNRKAYLDDEELEGPRLEKVLLWGVLSLMVIGVGLPLYWVTEPNRQAGAVDYFDDRLSGKTYHHGQPVGGGALFAVTAEGGFNCAGCHGGDAATGGQKVPYTLTDPVTGDLRQVQWEAPALDTATLRYSDESLKDILVYGRPFSPMPAWGIEGGGPMNDQQIDNLIKYLHRIEISRDEARARNDAATFDERARLAGLDDDLADLGKELAKAESDADKADIQEQIDELTAEIEGDDDTLGPALFNMNCARCHTKGWSYGDPQEPGAGGFGPPLYNTTEQFPAEEDHIEWVTNGRQDGERYGEVGQASGRMPYFLNILTTEQIEAIVKYERSLRQGEGS